MDCDNGPRNRGISTFLWASMGQVDWQNIRTMLADALAVMNHPNVAKVFDAGISSDGRPYFVMEYVPGEPITTYCDRHKLTIRQRLELFIHACDAVHHSHQKAIIHRDIKPSNVLVMVADGKPVVKVIDFGVAKALDHHL